ncbi:MAG: uroporphyrinogen decarboxylase [Pseudomonadota bacterium]
MTEPALLRALAGEAVDPAPIWLMRQAGRYLPEYKATRAEAGGFLDLCFAPDLATEVTLQPIRRFGFDAAILFSDILVTPLALGQKVWFAEGEGPRLDPVVSAAALDALSMDLFLERLAPVFEAIRQIKAALPLDVPLIGFAGAPWTLATYMIAGRGSTDHAVAKQFVLAEPELFARMIDLLTEAVGVFLVKQREAGVDAVKLFDSWAGAAWPSLFDRAVAAPAQRIVEAVRAADPQTPVIAFPRGAGASAARYAALVRPNGLALDSAADLACARDAVDPSICLQGNLDPIFLRGPTDPMARELDAIRAAMAGRAHILNLGHGITPESRIEAVSFLVDHWRRR